MLTKELTGSVDFDRVCEAWAEEQGTFLLKSGGPLSPLSRWSFLGTAPFVRLIAWGDRVEVHQGGEIHRSSGDPFQALRDLLSRYPCPRHPSLPFVGGAVGYFGYGLASWLEKLPPPMPDETGLPDLLLGFYDGVLAHDRLEGRLFAVAAGVSGPEVATLERLARECQLAQRRVPSQARQGKDHTRPTEGPAGKGAPQVLASLGEVEYLERVRRVKEYIRAGDVYQVNFTQRFSCSLPDRPWDLWRRLSQVNPAPFSAWLHHREIQVVSASPERFLRVEGGRVSTRPIKGTRPRGTTPEQDQALRRELETSGKDRAELLMIVDLERNDLGRVAVPGSVQVPELFALEEHPTVFHQVAEITAELEPGNDLVDLLRATFPGGSITGAPKVRAMELIAELEATRRGPYTGALGWLGFDGDADLNIVIRTFACRDDRAWFNAGGGIVWDSDPEEEYQEMRDKVAALFRALGRDGAIPRAPATDSLGSGQDPNAGEG